MAPAVLPPLRPPVAPPGSRARGRCDIGRPSNRGAVERVRVTSLAFPWGDPARGCPCRGAGVGGRAKPGWRSEGYIERPEGRRPEGSVRRCGTGNPELRWALTRHVAQPPCFDIDADRGVCESPPLEIPHATHPLGFVRHFRFCVGMRIELRPGCAARIRAG